MPPYLDNRAGRSLISLVVEPFDDLPERDAETSGLLSLMVINDEINLSLILTDSCFNN